MKTAAVLLAILGCSLALPSPKREIDWDNLKTLDVFVDPLPDAPIVTGRVVGGTEAGRNSLPYQAALFINGNSFCGGSLISRGVVLTAAHCTRGASYVDVVLGAHNVRQTESTQRTATSRSIVNHASYNPSTLVNDIALVRLPSQVTLTSAIQLINLAASSAGNYAGSSVVLSGWGRTSDNSNAISNTLQRVSLSVITNAVCSQTFSNIQSSHICTSGSGSRGACNGDSGGPIVSGSTQVGVVSFGSSRGCASGAPTAYARVSSYRSWISSNGGP